MLRSLRLSFQSLQDALTRLTSRRHKQQLLADAQLFPSLGLLAEDARKRLSEIVGVDISKVPVYEQALLHRSYLTILNTPSGVKPNSNERLEFLGDAILGMVVAEYLFTLYTDVPEGEMTKIRSKLVNRSSLAWCGKAMGVEELVFVSFSARGSIQNGSETILADTVEALIAAVYLDQGFDAARSFIISRILMPLMHNESAMRDSNFKSQLLEYVQSRGSTAPQYVLANAEGPDHARTFTVVVMVEDKEMGTGIGKSKKEAEQQAAGAALRSLGMADEQKSV